MPSPDPFWCWISRRALSIRAYARSRTRRASARQRANERHGHSPYWFAVYALLDTRARCWRLRQGGRVVNGAERRNLWRERLARRAGLYLRTSQPPLLPAHLPGARQDMHYILPLRALAKRAREGRGKEGKNGGRDRASLQASGTPHHLANVSGNNLLFSNTRRFSGRRTWTGLNNSNRGMAGAAALEGRTGGQQAGPSALQFCNARRASPSRSGAEGGEC